MTKQEKIEKEIFKMVYQWGRVGLVTDEKCNSFQALMKEYAENIKDNVYQEIRYEQNKKIIEAFTVWLNRC